MMGLTSMFGPDAGGKNVMAAAAQQARGEFDMRPEAGSWAVAAN
jgi:hypothetical protein